MVGSSQRISHRHAAPPSHPRSSEKSNIAYVVFIPKRRKQKIFGSLRKHLGAIFHELAGHKESRIMEGHLMLDHVHMCLSVPPRG